MKSYKEIIEVKTKRRIDFLDISEQVSRIIEKSGILEGIVLVNSMHITSSIFINDAESGLIQDFQDWLEKLAPKEFDYRHHATGENNGFSHLWRQIMGREVVVSISNGKMDFGTWERIFYGEFDGQRQKKILVKVIGE